MQVMALHSLEDQIDALVDMGKIREALALCEACGSAGKDFTDALRVALGVHLCDTVRCCHYYFYYITHCSAVLIAMFCVPETLPGGSRKQA